MSKATRIRCFDYVNHPYGKVCAALALHSNEVFHQATKSAETRAEKVAAGLHVKIAGIEFGKEILIDIKGAPDIESNSKKEMTIQLEWKAATAPRLFPTMVAQLHVYPISSTETQLDFEGEYEPPMGIVGKALDAVAGRRIAEASVHHFVNEVADYLRKNVDR
jgi:hypothetical protein